MLEAINKIRRKNDEARDLVSKIKKTDAELDTAELVCTKTDGKTKYDFNLFASPLKFARKIHNYEITLNEAMDDQEKLENLIIRLENYKPRNTHKKEEKDKVLESARKLLYVRNDIFNAFNKNIFPCKDSESKTTEERSGEKSEDINNTFIFIEEKSDGINIDLFAKYFNFSKPIDLAKHLYETKDKKKISELVVEIKNRWSNLKDETKKISEEEIKGEKPNQILEVVNKILNFNKEIWGLGLKILTPNQMLSRLPITLAQLKAGNNSEKLKNEIRQLLYSLYRSKKLTKQLYKSLIDII